MYKNIVVAMDGSDTAFLALDEAVKLARESSAEFRIVSVIDEMGLVPPVDFLNYAELLQSTREDLGRDLERAASLVRSAGVPVSTCLLQTDANAVRISEVIENAAKEWPADLLVIGTHGRRGFNHLLLGSVAEALIRISTFPVLLVRSQNGKG